MSVEVFDLEVRAWVMGWCFWFFVEGVLCRCLVGMIGNE